MPLTAFQIEVLRVLAANRSAASHIAGGLALKTVSEKTAKLFPQDLQDYLDLQDRPNGVGRHSPFTD